MDIPGWPPIACSFNAVGARSQFFQAASGYAEGLRCAEDYDLWLRALYPSPERPAATAGGAGGDAGAGALRTAQSSAGAVRCVAGIATPLVCLCKHGTVWGGRILTCFPVHAASHCGWVIVAGPAGGNVSTTRSTEQAREALHACHRAVCRALGRDVPFRCVQCFVQGSEAILTPADASGERSDDVARAVGHVRAAVELLRDLAAVVVATTPGGVYSHFDRAAAVAVRKDAQRRAAELGTAAVATWGIAGLPVIAAWKEMQTP